MPRIGLTGDVMLGRNVDERQQTRPVDAVWGDLLDRLEALDGLVINLECCLSTRGEPWTRTKRRFKFRADPGWAIPALERAGVDACALANNHVLDFEVQALRDTLDHLDGGGIARSGAGETLDEALDPAQFSAGGVDVALVSFTDNTPEYAAGTSSGEPSLTDVREDAAERGSASPDLQARQDAAGTSSGEPSLTDVREDAAERGSASPRSTSSREDAADESSPGTAWIEIDHENPETRMRVSEALDRAREADPDLVIASLHWGPNMVEEPPESFRAFARWLVDEGVDAIHGHSAHVFHGVELRDGAPVLYDAGDFVDDYRVDPTLRNDRSFLFELVVDDDGTPTELRLFPVEIDEYAVHEASEAAAEWSRERMRSLSAEFGTEFEREGRELVVDLGG